MREWTPDKGSRGTIPLIGFTGEAERWAIAFNDAIRKANEQYDALQERYDTLVKEVIAMKRDGFVPSIPMDAPKPVDELPQVIGAALRDLALDPMTERALRKQAWELLRAGVDEADVARRLTDGETVDL